MATISVSKRTVILILVALGFGLTPVYHQFWWWDVVAHVLATAGFVRLLRDLDVGWEPTLVILVAASIGWEMFEYHHWLFITGPIDTLSDLAVNVSVWVTLRGFSVWGTAETVVSGLARSNRER